MSALDTADVTASVNHRFDSRKLQSPGDWDAADTSEALGIWDDWGVVDALCRERDEQARIVSGLVRLTECSLNGYVEVLEFASDANVIRFAEVVVRQRAAQLAGLRGTSARKHCSTGFDDEFTELNNVWRVAIWNLEQDRPRDFFELAARAEAQLEEAFLAAAGAFRDAKWSSGMTDCAVAVCGAQLVWEEFAATGSLQSV